MRKINFVKTFFIITLTLILFNCKNNKEDIQVAKNRIKFNTIKITDRTGVQLKKDTNNSRFDDIWTSFEESLFSRHYPQNGPTENYTFSNFPNPTTSETVLNYMGHDSLTVVDLRIVDKYYKEIVSLDSITDNLLFLDLSKKVQKDTIRIYYKFIKGNLEYRGHNDVIIE